MFRSNGMQYLILLSDHIYYLHVLLWANGMGVCLLSYKVSKKRRLIGLYFSENDSSTLETTH